MIMHMGTAMLYVSDQYASVKFYRDVMGFSVVTDQDMGDGARWIEMAPPQGFTTIALLDAAHNGKQPGEGAYLTFACDDVEATIDELRGKCADIVGPEVQPWGSFAFINGPDGHRVQIHQRSAESK